MSNHRSLYGVVAGVLVILLIIMLVTWNYSAPSTAAIDKAQQLNAAFAEKGLPPPAPAVQVARVLGTDGGPVCAGASSDQQLGYLKTQLGVGGEFYVRPILIDARVLVGLQLIVQTYCPENSARVQDFIDGLKTDTGVIRS